MEENRSTILRINENAGNGGESTLLPLPTLIRRGSAKGEGRGGSEKRDVYAGICETSEGGGGFRGAHRRVVVSRLRRRHRANVAEIKSLTLLTDALVSVPALSI